jgi:hypothetical protein
MSFLACKSKQFVGIEKNRVIPLDSLLLALKSHNLEFDWFDAKAKVRFENPEESGTANCRIRIKKDSVIWMNFKKLGVEASRILIRPDSFFIIYRLDRKYDLGAMEDIRRIYDIPINFDWIQQMVFGNIPLPSNEGLVKIMDNQSYYQLKTELEDYTANYILSGDLSLFQLNLKDQFERELKIDFSDYNMLEGGLNFSYLRQYKIPFQNGANSIAKFDFSNVELNVPKSIKFKIPEDYQKL